MKIGQYCQRQRCRHVELEQFWQAFASRGFVSDSWAFLLNLLIKQQILKTYKFTPLCKSDQVTYPKQYESFSATVL